jgi:hypothetical protein
LSDLVEAKDQDQQVDQEGLERLRVRCEVAAKLWGRTFSALTAMTFREKGEDAIHKLWFLLLASHQGDHFREGLKKLGIHDDPPAVAAAKYHYFTNIIGGLDMEYVEESPRKVWIRYKAPMWTYAGVAMIALPGSLRRTILSSWHPRNGIYMGCPRLGYVGTKFIMEGEPYDEGYFIVPGYLLISSGGLGAAILGQFMLALPLTIIAACVVVVQTELFPTKLRYSGASVGYNIAYAIFGGTAPFVGAFLVERTGSNLSPAWYGMAIAAVAFLIILLKLPETYRLPVLRGEEAQEFAGGPEERRTQPT